VTDRRPYLMLVLALGLAASALPRLQALPSQARAKAAAPAPAPAAPLWYDYTVVNVYPHAPDAFTQGLIFRDGFLYESTGQYGESSLRRVELETGRVVQRLEVDARYFAEGLVDWGERLIQITWQSQVGFVYNRRTFVREKTFRYTGEGWGLTHDQRRIIMSDGTEQLRFLDPTTLAETGRVTVTDRGYPVSQLNELEMVKGQIMANIWNTDTIVLIAPDTGRVAGRIDMRGLLAAADRARGVDVLNGIAYDARGDRLFVTGKLWPKLFEIRLRPRGAGAPAR
jgi:glutaminyl-peptide cyclotransferase